MQPIAAVAAPQLTLPLPLPLPLLPRLRLCNAAYEINASAVCTTLIDNKTLRKTAGVAAQLSSQLGLQLSGSCQSVQITHTHCCRCVSEPAMRIFSYQLNDKPIRAFPFNNSMSLTAARVFNLCVLRRRFLLPHFAIYECPK